MKVYLDSCCLNRPFDDQTRLRIHLESEAIRIILSLCEQKEWQLISSKVIEFEIENAPENSKKKRLELIISLAETTIKLGDEVTARAKFFESSGLQAFDALHLACAESHADVLLTVDDKFLKKVASIKGLKVLVSNPLRWIEEVLQ